MMECLIAHNCPDVTDRLRMPPPTISPRVRGGFGEVYEGWLHDNRKVAIKCPTLASLDRGDKRQESSKVCNENSRYDWYLTFLRLGVCTRDILVVKA
jgi:hypothetical protein